MIRTRRLVMREESAIGSLNVVDGNFSVWLRRLAMIGNRNVINQGPLPASAGPVLLRLGVWAKITASHYVNVSDSVLLGALTTIGGAGSQLWTHGFVYLPELKRPMVRGKIQTGRNVYIGSQCCVSPGVMIATGVAVGAHSSVANSLTQPGVYVSAPLRYFPSSPEKRMEGLHRIADDHYRREAREWKRS
jgi:UDP-3-O-[3-hydroxymyristoyl] glucosamine N-acyltransferase